MLLKTPRCPAKVISSPSGPWTTLTPGVSVAGPRTCAENRRGADRRLVRACWPRRCASVSTAGAWPVTVTVSATPDTSSPAAASRLADGDQDVLLHQRRESGQLEASPCSGPAAAAGPRNGPRGRSTSVRVKLVSTFRTSTSTPGSTAPLARKAGARGLRQPQFWFGKYVIGQICSIRSEQARIEKKLRRPSLAEAR